MSDHVWDPKWLPLWRQTWFTSWNSFNRPVGHGCFFTPRPCTFIPGFAGSVSCLNGSTGHGAIEPLSHAELWLGVISIPGGLPSNMAAIGNGHLHMGKFYRSKWRIFPANHVWLPEGTHKGRECLEPEDHDSILSQSAWRSATSWQCTQVYTARGIGLPISRRTPRHRPWATVPSHINPIGPIFVGQECEVLDSFIGEMQAGSYHPGARWWLCFGRTWFDVFNHQNTSKRGRLWLTD